MKIKALLIAAFIPLLFACDDDNDTESGGGFSSDGGAQSSQYAGKYHGQIAGQARAKGIGDANFSEPISIVVNRNGTLSITIQETTFSGVINGNRVQARASLPIRQDWGSCTTQVTMNGTVEGRQLEGALSGDGDCTYQGVKSIVTITGNFATTRR